MGYAIIMSPCCGCQRVCCYNPPSTVDVARQPICLECIFRVNPDELKGIVVLPGVDQPEGCHTGSGGSVLEGPGEDEESELSSRPPREGVGQVA